MEYCKTCGQVIPPYLPRTGDYVQNKGTGQLAIVPARDVRFIPQAHALAEHVVVIVLAGTRGLPPGHLTQWKLTNIEQVHGFFRVTGRV